ncbi:ABC transporter ATP-binding protein [Noviherbaspirillum cavernae]|uniref:ABC transporter ATP-binding protein n=1 Tax=Noviherbaspirillum cavernae TaxID=2320862 RepID=A0A418WVX2_9BURK|nr:ABC transporter ATP-binding protein [Noviherbaspirillum cavernae]RJF96803.1 ABC transporter ATP-binding protein [Noviherbaspirillum cavernae]
MLDIKDIHSGYGDIRILRGINLSLSQGEFVGLWGHNGMGKSTLMRTILGYLTATAGSISFEGQDITGMATFRRAQLGIGLVPQGRAIFPHLSVLDNLRMGAVSFSQDRDETVSSVLKHFPRLNAYLDRPGGLLSGGEQQLLALARCLCGKPKLMLLDEPTEGIQPSIISEMVDTLHRIRESTGLTLLLVEQNQAFIGSLADRVLTMQKGVLVNESSTRDFLNNTHAFASA